MKVRNKIDFARARAKLVDTADGLLVGKHDVGLADIKRDLADAHANLADIANDGPVVSRILTTLGWQRDGMKHTGHDTTPRYVPRPR